MKINPLYGLLALGIALITTPGKAQTTPAGTVSSSTRPQGAVAPDSMAARESARMQKRSMKRNRKAQRSNAQDTPTNTSVQNARYRESSASDGTSVNNSNVTNYNSNNVMNAPTGVGSNPNTDKALQVETESTGVKTSTGTSTANSDAGAVEAIKGAKTTRTPAVKSGSTVRNTSIGDFLASSPNYITLQNALQSSDLFDVLKGTGPYTIFAPANDAFKKLPTAVQGGLLDGSNRDALKQLLSGHVVSGSMNSDDLSQKIKAGGGKAQLKTLSGSTLTAQLGANGRIQLTDEQGGVAHVEDTGSRQQNGVVYGIDAVLLTKEGAAAFR
jgi:uncharacterized surface protein with fasciclin (FAS1) repeats